MATKKTPVKQKKVVTPKVKVKAVKPVVESYKYEVEIHVNNEVLVAKTNDLVAVFKSFKRPVYKTKAILRVTDLETGAKTEKVYMIPKIKQLLSSETSINFLVKNIKILIHGV